MTELDDFELSNSWIHLDQGQFRVLFESREARGLIGDIRERRIAAAGAAAGQVLLVLLPPDCERNSIRHYYMGV